MLFQEKKLGSVLCEGIRKWCCFNVKEKIYKRKSRRWGRRAWARRRRRPFIKNALDEEQRAAPGSPLNVQAPFDREVLALRRRGGANAGDDPRETALIWPLMPSHLVDVRYFVSDREWNYRLRFRGREREREKCEKKRTRRGKNEYTFGPRAKYIRSCRKRMNYPCMARMKKRRGKKIGVKTQKRKKIALYSALGKNVYITRKKYIF